MVHIMYAVICLIVAFATPVVPQGLDFTLYICTNPGNCQPEEIILIADYYYVCEDPITCNEVQKHSHPFYFKFYMNILTNSFTFFLLSYRYENRYEKNFIQTLTQENYEKQLGIAITNGDSMTFSHYERGGGKVFMASGDK